VIKPSNKSDFMSDSDTSTANQFVLGDISVSTATPELPSPLLTASGKLTNAALVLVKIRSKCGVEGHSYLFSPSSKLLPALASAVSVAFEEVKGKSCSPETNTDYLLDKFKLFGGTGILTMAFAAIDMASWDLLGRALGKPLYRLWGGTQTTIPSYESSGLSIGSFGQVLDQAERFLSNGNSRMKVRLGYETIAEEVMLLSRLKDELGNNIELMVDYNQGLTFDQALERCKELDDLGLTWIEEPILADMLEKAANLTNATKTPIQLGENLWSLTEVERALNLGASDYLMPDVAKIGGATQWLRAAKMAERHGLKVSSHLYPEISAHLMASISNAHYLEYADWTKLQFSGHQSPQNNHVIITDKTGVGLH
jgi:mandelate racemase